MLAVVAACIRGNDRLKICVHNRTLWAQILCQNSIMDDADQAVQTALGRRLPSSEYDDESGAWHGSSAGAQEALVSRRRALGCKGYDRWSRATRGTPRNQETYV